MTAPTRRAPRGTRAPKPEFAPDATTVPTTPDAVPTVPPMAPAPPKRARVATSATASTTATAAHSPATPAVKQASPKAKRPKPPLTPAAVAASRQPRRAAAPRPAKNASRATTAAGEPDTTALRILMIASEAFPFSKTGGLAEVATALPKALARLGHDVTLVTPRYRGVAQGTAVGRVAVQLAGFRFDVQFTSVDLAPTARVLLADCPSLYDRSGLYNDDGTDYPDNALRFAVLNAAALEWALSQSRPPDVVHTHDWQGGLAPVYLASGHERTQTNLPTVFTIHNLAYQGNVDKTWVPRLGLRWEHFTTSGFEFWDHLSLLKAGVNFADIVTTVSPTYADEIQRPEYGYGFDGVMRRRREALVGILNGIDTDEWNPAADRHLPAPYDAADLGGKRLAKRALLETFGLAVDEAALARPLVGMVSRLVDQKGFDLLAQAASEFLAMDATFVLLGSGERRYEDLWNALHRARPSRFGVHVGFDERRAHLVEGGADLFLMPSRYEPCGLNQMYSLRYGTVPVVRAVGGLVDTVQPFDAHTGTGTGFLFADYSPWALVGALAGALATFQNREVWTRLQQRGMAQDFSWDRSAAEYVTVYKGVIATRHKTPV